MSFFLINKTKNEPDLKSDLDENDEFFMSYSSKSRKQKQGSCSMLSLVVIATSSLLCPCIQVTTMLLTTYASKDFFQKLIFISR